MNDEPRDEIGPGHETGPRPGPHDRSVALTAIHAPLRPTWLCRVCANPYPCRTARVLLLRAFRGNTLTLFMMMSGMLTDAYADLPTVTDDPEATSPLRLYTRFLDWMDAGRRRGEGA